MSDAATLDKPAAAPSGATQGAAPGRTAAQARRRRLLTWLAIAVLVGAALYGVYAFLFNGRT
ncbi:MAG: hypothetical protein ACXWKR_13350, partial [Phenylobacterium sp.]